MNIEQKAKEFTENNPIENYRYKGSNYMSWYLSDFVKLLQSDEPEAVKESNPKEMYGGIKSIEDVKRSIFSIISLLNAGMKKKRTIRHLQKLNLNIESLQSDVQNMHIPTDEDIDDFIDSIPGYEDMYNDYRSGLMEGAKWLRSKVNPNQTESCNEVKDIGQDTCQNVILPKRLTAENGAKALLSGQFVETFDPDDCGNPYIVPISWSKIKHIYSYIVNHFAKDINVTSKSERVEGEWISVDEIQKEIDTLYKDLNSTNLFADKGTTMLVIEVLESLLPQPPKEIDNEIL